MENHRVLLTGANGFIGSTLFQHFHSVALSIDILSRDCPLADQFQAISSKYPGSPSKFTLIHCASATPVNSSSDSIFHDNLKFALDICTANLMHELLSNIINLSSMSVYGAHSTPLVSESTTPGSLSPYGASKLAVEHILSSHSDLLNISCTHLRLPGVVGPKSYERSRNLVSTIKYNCLLGLPLVLSNPESFFNNIVHVASLIDILELACKSTFSCPRIINLSSLDALCLSDVVSIMKRNLNSASSVSWVQQTQEPFAISTALAIQAGLPLISTHEAINKFCADPL